MAQNDPNKKPARSKATLATKAQTYVNPIGKGLVLGRTDQGVDYGGKGFIYAIGKAKVKSVGLWNGWPPFDGSGGGIVYELLEGQRKGTLVYVMEGFQPDSSLRAGATLEAGQKIGYVPPGTSTGIETGWADAAGTNALAHPHYSEGHATPEGQDFLGFVQDLSNGGQGTAGGIFGTGGSGSSSDPNAKATAFATFIDLPGVMASEESLLLTGDKSLMNDKPLFPFVEQLCSAGLRNFMSMPNGDFFAFYPDYFGGLNHRTPYWEIHDIEIIDATINLSDDALATHVYVVGDHIPGNFDGVTDIDRIMSSGVITIFNAFKADFMNGLPDTGSIKKQSKKETEKEKKWQQSHPSLANKEAATKFLQKYGARPYYEEAPMVRSPYYEAFLAYQRFCLLWSRQFLTTFEFTFMPELFPGGIVAFPEHGIQCYIDEVVHECDYERGFTTRANLSAPAAIRDKHGKIADGKQYISAGMIRGFSV